MHRRKAGKYSVPMLALLYGTGRVVSEIVYILNSSVITTNYYHRLPPISFEFVS
jgi:site-specific recombinase XerD